MASLIQRGKIYYIIFSQRIGEELQWFKSIEDISNKLKLKNGKPIVLQADFTATPKHNNGAIFVQTITDYPLVEAIRDNVVKSPVLPDQASRLKLEEKDSNDFVERYKDFLHLGYLEWKQQYEELKSQKTPILFIMTMSTKEADKAAKFLEREYPEMEDAVLTIHTNRKGELKENVRSAEDEIEELRKAADLVDSDESPFKAVCTVLMLREGWDVKNVSTIVGLRPFNADSKILPEQAIGCFWLCLFAGEEQLNPRKISSRFGFTPHPYQSGTSVKGKQRSSGFGNGEMRRLMYQAARSVATHNAHFNSYYQKKLAEGKEEKLIMNNIINKIIRTVCSMSNHNVDYNPGYIQEMKKIHKAA